MIEIRPEQFPAIASNEVWWCNSHQRRATEIERGEWVCGHPYKGGIMILCDSVRIDKLAEITESP